MELEGKIKLINEEQTFGASGFRKRELVIVTPDQYPQMILIEFVQEKCDLLNNFKVGQDIKVQININGREWINPEGVAKYFNAIQGWRIEPVEGTALDEMPPANTNTDDGEPDGLPF